MGSNGGNIDTRAACTYVLNGSAQIKNKQKLTKIKKKNSQD